MPNLKVVVIPKATHRTAGSALGRLGASEFVKGKMNMESTLREKTGQELSNERSRRLMDAIAIKVPDQVPLFTIENYFPAKYAGVPKKVVHFDPPAWYAAMLV
jgi:hypothetical protein